MSPEELKRNIEWGHDFRTTLDLLVVRCQEDGYAEDSNIMAYLRDMQSMVNAWLADPADPQMLAEMTSMLINFNERTGWALKRGKA